VGRLDYGLQLLLIGGDARLQAQAGSFQRLLEKVNDLGVHVAAVPGSLFLDAVPHAVGKAQLILIEMSAWSVLGHAGRDLLHINRNR
jgi:hypothetical protein